MSAAKPLLINCRITTVIGTVVTEFTVDHMDGYERQYLGAQCQKAFEAGHKVETWPDGVGFVDASKKVAA